MPLTAKKQLKHGADYSVPLKAIPRVKKNRFLLRTKDDLPVESVKHFLLLVFRLLRTPERLTCKEK